MRARPDVQCPQFVVDVGMQETLTVRKRWTVDTQVQYRQDRTVNHVCMRAWNACALEFLAKVNKSLHQTRDSVPPQVKDVTAYGGSLSLSLSLSLRCLETSQLVGRQTGEESVTVDKA